jgi:hypothetical protein
VKIAQREVAIRDVTFDTGTYVTGGNSITAASVGLKTIDFVDTGTMGMTGGTSGATINWIGVTYAANRQSVTFQQYESAATGLPGLEKTSAEATVANATFRVGVLEFRLMWTPPTVSPRLSEETAGGRLRPRRRSRMSGRSSGLRTSTGIWRTSGRGCGSCGAPTLPRLRLWLWGLARDGGGFSCRRRTVARRL